MMIMTLMMMMSDDIVGYYAILHKLDIMHPYRPISFMAAACVLRLLLQRLLCGPDCVHVIMECVGTIRCSVCDEHAASTVKDAEGAWHWVCVDCVVCTLPDDSSFNIHCCPGSLEANHSQEDEDEELPIQAYDSDEQ